MESNITNNIDRDRLLDPLQNSKSPVTLADLKRRGSHSWLRRPQGITIALVAILLTTGIFTVLLSSSNQEGRPISLRAESTHIPPAVASNIVHSILSDNLELTHTRKAIHSRPSFDGGSKASLLPSKADIRNQDSHSDPQSSRMPMAAQNELFRQAAGSDTSMSKLQETTKSFDRIVTSRPLALEPKERLYGAIQYGTVMGSINSFGGGVAVTASHDWLQASFRYTGTFGLTSSELFFQPVGKSGSQKVSEYAILFGARLEQGDFWASFEAGPNIVHASFNTYYSYPRFDTLDNEIGGGLGASAQATFGYRFNDYLGLNLTGFVSNHTVTYGGILFSLVAGRL